MAANLSLGKLEEVVDRLDAAIERGIADAEAERVTPADVVFDRLTAKYQSMAEPKDYESKSFPRD